MSHRVLLVDDEPNVLEGLRRTLRKENYEILCARSGAEALRFMREAPVDLVISDQEMPGMRGTELLALVREEFPDTVRYILTGKGTLDVAVAAINQGEVNRFLVKPCVAEELIFAIRVALQQKDLFAEARRLLRTVQEQAVVLEQIEEQSPGLTKVVRDADGSIVIEDIPGTLEDFMTKVRETLGD